MYSTDISEFGINECSRKTEDLFDQFWLTIMSLDICKTLRLLPGKSEDAGLILDIDC